MNFAPYPAYKDSGVPWLGQVPEGWKTSRIDFQCTVKARLGWKGLTASEYVDEGFILLATPNIKNKEIDFENVNYINERRYLESPEIMIEPGDVLLAKDGSTLGTVNFVRSLPRPATVNSSIAIIRPRKQNIDGAFLFRWIEADIVQSKIHQMKDGQGVPHLFQSDIRKFPVPLPPLEEQIAIARFVDEKTAEIDDLIAKKEELLRLLAEQRTALITHAVTKGLNSSAPKKSSGVAWLGDVPKRWEVRPLKYLGRFQNGISIGGESFGSGFPFISYGDVYNSISLPKMGSGLVESTDKDRLLYSVEYGDIFFTRTSETIEEIAISSVCEATIPDAVFAGFLIRCRPYPNRLSTGFSKYYFRNSRLRDYFVKEMNLVTRASLGQTLLGNLMVALPPLDEQESISKYLDEKLTALSKVEASGRASIQLLKEYRTSIITNAVTGKIKVA